VCVCVPCTYRGRDRSEKGSTGGSTTKEERVCVKWRRDDKEEDGDSIEVDVDGVCVCVCV
jgi:hypothetical protein